jgi:hypothetical protein
MSEYIIPSDPFEGFGRTALRSPRTRRASPITAPAAPSGGTSKKAAAKKTAAAAAKAKAKSAAKKKSIAKAKKGARRKGPPPWANPSFRRDADSKVAKAMPPGVRAVIDQLPLSSDKKSKLKGSPVSFLIDLAKNDPQAVADYIKSVRSQGGNVALPSAKDNPAALASKLVTAASSKPSAAVKAAAEQAALSGFGTIVPTTTRMSFTGLAPALAALSPITLPALKSIATSRPALTPTATQISAAANAANTAAAMQAATSPEATAAATAAANEENKILGLPPLVVYGGGALVIGLGLMRVLKKK